MIAVVSLLCVLALAGAFGGVVVGRARSTDDRALVELRFPGDVSEQAVWGVLGVISGLPMATRAALEVVGSSDGIRHYLGADQAIIDVLRSHLRGLLPGVRLEPVEASEPVDWRLAARVRFGGRHPLLLSDRGGDSAAALLGALSGLHTDELVLVRWSLRPARGPYVSECQSRAQTRNQGPLMRFVSGGSIEPSHMAVLRSKYGGPVLRGSATIAVSAASEGRRVNLMTRVVAVIRARAGLQGRPLVRSRSGSVRRFVERAGLQRGSLYSPAELLGLIGWPIDGPQVPGLVLGTAPQLLPSGRIPSRGGLTLALATWPGMERRRLVQPLVGALSHTVVVGGTGVGKSSLLSAIAAEHLAARRGLLLIDGKGDLAEQVLGAMPAFRRDVIVLDPGGGGPVPGLRVFGGGDPDVAGDLILGVLRQIFIESWGVYSDKWLRAALVTLAHEHSATLGDLPFLFSSDGYRRRLVGRLTDPILQSTWAEFEALSPEARAHQLGSPLGKVNELLGRRSIRSVIAQTEPRWDLRQVLARGQVVIVSLSPGSIGAPASRLLGALVMHELAASIQARARIPVGQRRPFYVLVDEPKVFTDISLPLDSLFELARGLGVGLTLAAQSLAQLPDELARAALTNAATLVAFRQNHDDARLLAHELPGVTPGQLQALGRFEIAARIGLGPGDVSPPVTGRTLASPEPISDPDEVRRLSAERYGRRPDDVDVALAERHGLDEQSAVGADAVPLRRRRRSES